MVTAVTGGAGFIGANYIYYLLEKYSGENRIICIDKLTYAGNQNNLKRAVSTGRVVFYKADICQVKEIDGIFQKEKPDVVINFAAESHVDRSLENPGVFLNTNVLGVGVLMELCLKHKVGRFHQVSTDEVYGDLPLDSGNLRFTEESPLRPSSPYSASKASADLLVSSFVKSFGLNATVSRCTNNYGFYQHSEKLIPKLIEMAVKNLPMPIYGSGQNVRDWIYTLDHCRAIDLIVKKGTSGQVYNVGASAEISNQSLAELICNTLGRPLSLITHVDDRPGHDLRYAVDASKIMKELSWKAEMPFHKGILKTIDWYKSKLDIK